MAEDVGERTEAATPRRREHAQQRGQFAQSRDLASAIILLAGIVGFHLLGESMLSESARLLRYTLGSPRLVIDPAGVRLELLRLVWMTVSALGFWTAIVLAGALVANYFQTGGPNIASSKSYFDLARLNPISGLSRIFSRRGLIRTFIDIAKVTVVAGVAYAFFVEGFGALVSLGRLPMPTLGAFAFAESLRLSYYLATVLLLLGIADYAYQRFQFEQDLRMTRQQVKDEAKDIEGDPQVKARRRQIQIQLARQRMMKELPEAEVVITNPTEIAVALKYKVESMDAPVVVAMGAGVFARRIREIAAKYRIPIIENRALARSLFRKAEVGRVIPPESFVAVAEILAYVYQITKRPVPPRPKRAS